MRTIKENTIYRHFKGNLYEVIAIATHSETEELCVVYRPLYGEGNAWVRPYHMFASEVDRSKYPEASQKYRFEEMTPVAEEKP